jgi:hypothetical protein
MVTRNSLETHRAAQDFPGQETGGPLRAFDASEILQVPLMSGWTGGRRQAIFRAGHEVAFGHCATAVFDFSVWIEME